MSKLFQVLLNALPVLVMIALIPFISSDYLLVALYITIIAVALTLKRSPNDFLILAFGFVAMIASEYLFVSTGVETFNRNTLFGLMPVWLPFLWGYGFVAIKRSVEILNVDSR